MNYALQRLRKLMLWSIDTVLPPPSEPGPLPLPLPETERRTFIEIDHGVGDEPIEMVVATRGTKPVRIAMSESRAIELASSLIAHAGGAARLIGNGG